MFIRLLYKDTNFHIYKIDENGNVKKSDEVLSNDDNIYHSTNGYDYVLLEKFDGTLTMYPLDKVVYNSFYPESLSVWNHFKCIHLNGDLRDNRLENLKGVKEEEEWRMITYPGLPKDTYMISSFGNVMNIKTRKLVGFTTYNGSYMRMTYDNHKYPIHRLAAYEFLKYDEWNSDTIINHIDNNGLNNNIMNLEIVTNRQNIHHAILIGAKYGKIRTEEMIRVFCELYVKYEGDIKKVKNVLKELNLINYFDTRRISQLIRKESWCDITDEYFKLGDYKLPYKNKLTENEIRYICKLLVKYNMSCAEVFKELQSDCNNRIMLNDIKKIRYKYQWTNISDEYFT